MAVLGVVQVRMRSSRLPGKAMADIEGRPMTWHIVNRLRHAELLEDVVIAVPEGKDDGPIRQMAEAESIRYFAGSEADLIDRLYKTALKFSADAIVRVTGDCPLVDAGVVNSMVQVFVDRAGRIDYVTNSRPPTYPHGLDAEIYTTATLQRLWIEIEDPLYREWFPVYLWEHENQYRTHNLRYNRDLSHLRWTVDYEEDLRFVREIYRRLSGRGQVFGMEDVLRVLEAEPDLMEINAGHDRKESYLSPTVIDTTSSENQGDSKR